MYTQTPYYTIVYENRTFDINLRATRKDLM